MNIYIHRLTIFFSMLFLMPIQLSHAQWSIGEIGDHLPEQGEKRYAFMVFANPRPMREQEFNHWYAYEHLGDLIQLEDWTGAQLFRIVSTLSPRLTREGYKQGYLALWDQETVDPKIPRLALDKAQDGGKARRSTTFDYVTGAAPKALYQVVSKRFVRADGRKMGIPTADDMVSHRLDRFIMLEYFNTPSGMSDAELQKGIDERVVSTLTLPGWMAAQRFIAVPTPGSRGAPDGKSPFPDNLVIWEVESDGAQVAQDVLTDAISSGLISSNTCSPTLDAICTFWQPQGPYIDRSAFAR